MQDGPSQYYEQALPPELRREFSEFLNLEELINLAKLQAKLPALTKEQFEKAKIDLMALLSLNKQTPNVPEILEGIDGLKREIDIRAVDADGILAGYLEELEAQEVALSKKPRNPAYIILGRTIERLNEEKSYLTSYLTKRKKLSKILALLAPCNPGASIEALIALDQLLDVINKEFPFAVLRSVPEDQTHITLSELALTRLHELVIEYLQQHHPRLDRLDLRSNNLENVPHSLNNLMNLKSLDLSHNLLLPADVGHLSIKNISLDGNCERRVMKLYRETLALSAPASDAFSIPLPLSAPALTPLFSHTRTSVAAPPLPEERRKQNRQKLQLS